MKVFVDTNVLVDFICKREPFFVPAKSLFALCLLGKVEIVISCLSAVNAIYIGRKYKSLDLKRKLKGLSQIVSFVDLSTSTVLESLDTTWKDYEDALQNATATVVGADCIVTRNKKDFEDTSLKVYTPEELLEVLCG